MNNPRFNKEALTITLFFILGALIECGIWVGGEFLMLRFPNYDVSIIASGICFTIANIVGLIFLHIAIYPSRY